MTRLDVFKKWSTRLVVSCFFFAGGVEYSIILPTCWDYMNKKFGAEEWMYGLTISAMSISNLIVGPVMGAIYDRTHWTKALVLFLNMFEIGGNFMYFAATSQYIVMGSRFLTGMGWSAGAVIFADLARTSTKRERTVLYSLVMSLRQLGVISGPIINIILRSFDCTLGPFVIDKYTLPGLVMGVLWLIIEVIFLFLYFQLPPLGDIEDKELQKSQISGQYTIQESKTITSNDYTEELPLLHNRTFINNHRKSSYNCCSLLKNKIVKFRTSVSDLLYEETVVLLTVLYFLLFAEYVLETGLVPTAEALLNWSDFETSLFFIVQSVINMTSLLTVAILSKLTRIGEIYYIIFGLVIQLGALVWLVFFFGNGQISSTDYAMYDAGFYIGLCVTVIALPFSWVTTTSLYSQVLPMRTQGFGQGVRRSTESLAAILGGLWGGAVFEVSFGYYLLYGVPTILLIMSLLFLLLSTSRIIRTTKLLQRLL